MKATAGVRAGLTPGGIDHVKATLVEAMENRDDHGTKFPAMRTYILIILVAGVAGEIVFEFIARVIAPPLLGRPMQPELLVGKLSSSIFGVPLTSSMAFAIHVIVGAVLMPLGYALFRGLFGVRGWFAGGLIWGFVLWVIAQAILAPLAGRPFMLGFIPYTWASLIAHLALGLTIAFVLQRLSERAART